MPETVTGNDTKTMTNIVAALMELKQNVNEKKNQNKIISSDIKVTMC